MNDFIINKNDRFMCDDRYGKFEFIYKGFTDPYLNYIEISNIYSKEIFDKRSFINPLFVIVYNIIINDKPYHGVIIEVSDNYIKLRLFETGKDAEDFANQHLDLL